MPVWMNNLFQQFNTSLLHSLFCFTEYYKPGPEVDILPVESEEAFFGFPLAKKPIFSKAFASSNPHPNELFSQEVVAELSRFYLRVYCALWSQPNESLRLATQQLIERHLDSAMRYSSVHKRGLDGGCNKVLADNTRLADYPSSQLSMGMSEWSGRLRHHHPLCAMSAAFARQTLALNNRSADTKIFLAFDGQGDVSDYRLDGNAVLLSAIPPLTSTLPSPSSSSSSSTSPPPPPMYIEMMVAMHGDVRDSITTSTHRMISVRFTCSALTAHHVCMIMCVSSPTNLIRSSIVVAPTI